MLRNHLYKWLCWTFLLPNEVNFVCWNFCHSLQLFLISLQLNSLSAVYLNLFLSIITTTQTLWKWTENKILYSKRIKFFCIIPTNQRKRKQTQSESSSVEIFIYFHAVYLMSIFWYSSFMFHQFKNYLQFPF